MYFTIANKKILILRFLTKKCSLQNHKDNAANENTHKK